ncbi:porin family protein [Hymenobacter cheonanensis]|uniref:porin family protein n=1 Tax=Hymenobacter sp. CA2-7 TaxID=3063993 RepID=UPI0027139FC1|nr:porin family protein [Hymenobacter sp. CA2-7]MDO7884243.1 porin family protein [Hymenobacter sp. CA2-7]
MKHFITHFLLGSFFLTTSAAQAQVRIRIGPQVGYTLSSASFSVIDYPDYFTPSGSYRSGFAAGLVAQLGLTDHLSLQPALLYARKAPAVTISSYYQPNNYYYFDEYTFQFNYLTLPVNLLYSQRADGQGGQVFLGPYLGWLLGGQYTHGARAGYGSSITGGGTYSGKVAAGDTYATSTKDSNYYSRQLDAGLQAGVGYGVGALQLQATFSLGLRNIGAAYAPTANNPYEAPVIRNRSFQLSAAYLFGPKL